MKLIIGVSQEKFLDDILIKEKDKEVIITVSCNALPLERSLALFDDNIKGKFQIVGQDYNKADYIFTNFISDIGKFKNYKYEIPENFILDHEFFVDSVKVFEAYKKAD